MTEHHWLSTKPDPVLVSLELPETAEVASAGVLFCPPFGWDGMTAHRALRNWARELAAGGHPAARLDYPGCGDSGGASRDPQRLQGWIDATVQAAGWLRDRAGCDRVISIGISLGGVIAYLAAAEGTQIDDLILWAVPARGRALVRELRGHAALVAARHPQDAPAGVEAPPETEVPRAAEGGDLELTGFVLSGETLADLQKIDLTALSLADPDRRRVMLLGRDRLQADRRLREHLEASGVKVTVADGSDYEALLAHPQLARSPTQTIAATAEWLANGTIAAAAQSRPSQNGHSPAVELRVGSARIRESVLELELPIGRTYGVLTQPLERPPEPLTGLLLPAGALRRIGPNRAWVEAARRWALRGVATLRVDLPGIGDADGHEQELVDNRCLYAEARGAEIALIRDQLRERGLPQRHVLGGLCSGAYWSLHAALEDPSVVGALMINLYSFWWSPELVAEREPGQALSALRSGGWRRLLRGDITRERLREAVASFNPRKIRASMRGSIEAQQRDPMIAALDQLRDQRTEALMVFSQGEPLLDQLVHQGFLGQAARWPNLRVEEIPSRDHMFRAVNLQQLVHERLDAALERVLANVPAR